MRAGDQTDDNNRDARVKSSTMTMHRTLRQALRRPSDALVRALCAPSLLRQLGVHRIALSARDRVELKEANVVFNPGHLRGVNTAAHVRMVQLVQQGSVQIEP